MELSHGDGQRNGSCPVIDGILCAALGEIDLDLTAAFGALDLQAAAALAELVRNDPFAVIAADGNFFGFVG